MATLDWLVVLAYFVGLLGLAWWVFRRGKDTADDYFLANRNLGWFIVGASIFASNIGSEHLVGLAGSGATRKNGDWPGCSTTSTWKSPTQNRQSMARKRKCC